jgi:hypothetical protein
MTTITAAHSMPALGASAPGDLVGRGDTSTRVLGGILGGGAGVGAMVGISAMTSRSSVAPVRIAGGIAGLAAIGGGAFLGQRLAGNATRSTDAEAARELASKQTDLRIQSRVLQAKADGGMSQKQENHIDGLRRERSKLQQSKPEANFFGKFALPVALGLGVAVGAGMLAGKLTHSDGKGINVMFNSLGAGMAGLGGGAWLGYETGKILTAGPHVDELPAEAAARIAAIDAELDTILGAA